MRALARSRPKDIPVIHRRLAPVLLVVVGVAWACGAGDEAPSREAALAAARDALAESVKEYAAIHPDSQADLRDRHGYPSTALSSLVVGPREQIRERGFADVIYADVIYADALLAWDEVTASITLRLRGRW